MPHQAGAAGPVTHLRRNGRIWKSCRLRNLTERAFFISTVWEGAPAFPAGTPNLHVHRRSGSLGNPASAPDLCATTGESCCYKARSTVMVLDSSFPRRAACRASLRKTVIPRKR
jgi:hypothetical protein